MINMRDLEPPTLKPPMPQTPELEQFVDSAHSLLARLRKSEPFLPGEMPVLIYTLGQLVQVVNKWDGENYETDHSGSA